VNKSLKESFEVTEPGNRNFRRVKVARTPPVR